MGPLMVGDIGLEDRSIYAQALLDYFLSPTTFFVISSDFCHWGSRFRYQFRMPGSTAPIWQDIQALDKQGMQIIESLDPKAFRDYLDATHNTICGRMPITLMLHLVAEARKRQNVVDFGCKFVAYSQSSRCVRVGDSSVSYASGIVSFSKK